MDTLQICKAKSKQSGNRCKNYVVKDKTVCHIHGGKSTGAKSNKGKARLKQAAWKHGGRSKQMLDEQLRIRAMIKKSKELIEDI